MPLNLLNISNNFYTDSTIRRNRFLSHEFNEEYKIPAKIFYFENENSRNLLYSESLEKHLFEYKNIFMKIIFNKLVIYFKENSIKADQMYDLTECDIIINLIKEKKIIHILLENPFISNISVVLDYTLDNFNFCQKLKRIKSCWE